MRLFAIVYINTNAKCIFDFCTNCIDFTCKITNANTQNAIY